MMEDLPSDAENKFLHDISNPLSIAYGGLKLITMKLENNINAIAPEEILERINKAIFQIERLTELLNTRREEIRNKEK